MPEKGKKRTELELQFVIMFREAVLTPFSWISKADELIQASKKLEPSIKKSWVNVYKYLDPETGVYEPPRDLKSEIRLQAPYFMLVAYAIENYFKAVLVAENKERYTREVLREGKLPDELKKNGHNLINLVTKMKPNFDPTEAELSLLTRLFRHSVWQGRYPVPGKADQLNNPVGYDGKRFDIKTIGLWYEDIKELKILVRRIKTFSSAKVLASELKSTIR